MKTTSRYIVGRQHEMQLFCNIVRDARPHSIVNIYGPGGIGKTVVCHKFEGWCRDARVPYATVSGDDYAASGLDRLLVQFRRGLVENTVGVLLDSEFTDFDAGFNEYLTIRQILARGGGLDTMFDVAGNLDDLAQLDRLLDTVQRGNDDIDLREEQEGVGYNLATLRGLLRTSFGAAELKRFCQNRPAFRPILTRWGPGFSVDDMIDAVIDYCLRRVLLDELVAAIQEDNPDQYRVYAGRLPAGEIVWQQTPRENLLGRFHHRDVLERYLDGADLWLTKSFIVSIERIVQERQIKPVLLFDAYEMMMGHDDWVCEILIKGLPDGAKVIILGRDRLSRANLDWCEYDDTVLYYHELQELHEDEAKAYLRQYGLRDEESLERVYAFTGGYPLCLVLAVELARELGWEGVRDFQDSANRDRVASQLLERILKQEKVAKVQEFLEKGVVARWFDPGAVSYILEISPEQGREIYQRIGEFSFVQFHPNGLKFHDRVRELLVERLKFQDGGRTYTQLARRWRDYFKQRAGV